MATSADARDILELGGGGSDAGPISKKDIINADKKKPKKTTGVPTHKRPEGMHREVYALLYADKKDAPPLQPSDLTQGYHTAKAKLGCKKVRPWKWMPFTNPARRDGTVFYHWRRVGEEGKDYPFSKFNKEVQVPVYSEQEYQMYLHDDGWTKSETDHLFDLVKRFDLRFIVVQDRYDHQQFRKRSVEDLKERYYSVCARLTKAHAGPGGEPKVYVFDANHERRRKEQLERLFNRTPEQVAEEEYLIQELRKMEAQKKEREKKAQDLQKLITAADTSTEPQRVERKATKKKFPQKRGPETQQAVPETTGIKFPDFKSAGVTLRSQRMKLPSSVGQKKVKAMEQILTEQGVDLNPIPTEEIAQMFNELRSDLVLLYQLKQAHESCAYEQQMLQHRYEALLKLGGAQGPAANGQAENAEAEPKEEALDVTGAPLTPSPRKKREGAPCSSPIKKAKRL
ncbi:DNA methyltransferase 1-associated protein 1-like isoform X1 [Megalops cyprinoides]|uniref:DNA methyltransferase 1-associated protein 1-like isoform X1 n=1 Tax=Megalops cyprinoides TaxID=118141 RepID=UPI001863E857|nr:DNA methyltransferase 1-associated protein 1-like isoform X1 [Megalops cyprinoides]